MQKPTPEKVLPLNELPGLSEMARKIREQNEKRRILRDLARQPKKA